MIGKLRNGLRSQNERTRTTSFTCPNELLDEIERIKPKHMSKSYWYTQILRRAVGEQKGKLQGLQIGANQNASQAAANSSHLVPPTQGRLDPRDDSRRQ